MDALFMARQSDIEAEIKGRIEAFNATQATQLEQELFKQRKRLVDAERALQVKVTKKASEDVRIATNKIWELLPGTHPKGAVARLKRMLASLHLPAPQRDGHGRPWTRDPIGWSLQSKAEAGTSPTLRPAGRAR